MQRILINLQRNYGLKLYSADVWKGDELTVTGYGNTKALAVCDARRSYKVHRELRRCQAIIRDVCEIAAGQRY